MKNATMNNNKQIDQTTLQRLNAPRNFDTHRVNPNGRSPQNDAKSAKPKSHGFLEDLFAGKCNFWIV